MYLAWRYLNADVVSDRDPLDNSLAPYIVNGHTMNEYFIRKVYRGSGTYFNTDGSVNPAGGPKDGMIRTKADLDWARTMVAANYQFNSGTKVGSGSGEIWYGELIMADENGDGKYGDSNDRVFSGKSSIPKITFGLNMSAEWKGIDFNMLWSGQLGSHSLIYSRGVNANVFSENIDALPADAGNLFYSYNHSASVNDPNYDPANDSNANITARYPRLYAGRSQIQTASDYYLFNTSFLKLRSLQIGYTLPSRWMSPAKINRCRLFVSAENLLAIKSSDFPGVDPEYGGNINSYPTPKMYTVGINLSF